MCFFSFLVQMAYPASFICSPSVLSSFFMELLSGSLKSGKRSIYVMFSFSDSSLSFAFMAGTESVFPARRLYLLKLSFIGRRL